MQNKLAKGEQSPAVVDGESSNFILNNLDNVSSEDGDEEDEQQYLLEYENRREGLIENFVEQVYEVKADRLDEARQQLKSENASVEDEKAKIAQVKKDCDVFKKESLKKMKAKIAEIFD